MKRTVFLVALLALGAGAAEIPWRVPSYTLTARNLPVRQALDTFGVAEGVPVVSSDAVQGVLSGDFKDVPANEFLDRLATIHNLSWYFDGATLFVYAGSEVQTMLLDLRYMKAGEVRALLKELGVEDARFPIKTASNDEMIMVSGPPRYVGLVAEMIARADKLREQRTFTEVVTKVFPLKYTWADNVSFTTGTSGETSQSVRGVADILRELMAVGIQSGFAEGSNATTKATAGFTPVIRAENRLNAVVVRDVASRMPVYAEFIAQLDRPMQLVEVGVTALEMSREDALDWQASLAVTFADQKSGAAGGINADNLLSSVTPTGLGAAGGYTYLGEHIDIDASISALKTDGRARSVTRTSLLTMNNMTAEISDTESYTTKLVGEKVASVSETSAGTRLACKPRIIEPPAGATNVARHIWLSMALQDGGLDKLNTIDGLPTKRTTSLTTQASLPEGSSLLLAGNFKDVDSDAGWGIPLLRDIPWIGWIFGGQSVIKTTVQRLFVITPHVIDLAYYSAATQDVVGVQMLRNRDVTSELQLEDAAKRDDVFRRKREAEVKEARDVRDERFREEFEREEVERDLRKDQRDAERDRDHEAWERDFEARKEAWQRSERGK